MFSRSQPFPVVISTVDSWDAEEGWGVLHTPDGSTVFCHFSHVVGQIGYVELVAGQRVEFDYKTPGQGGCDMSVSTFARAVSSPNAPAGALRRATTLPRR